MKNILQDLQISKKGALGELLHILLKPEMGKSRKKLEDKDWKSKVQEIKNKWEYSFTYKSELKNEDGEVVKRGLRPPQLGAIHATAAHWSLSKKAATIAMPTGTGKTEVMLSAFFSLIQGDNKLLVVVPNKALLDQTVKKFMTLGLLRELGVVPEDTPNPIVCVIKHRPKKIEDLKMLQNCHVAITTPNCISIGSATNFLDEIGNIFSYLFIDEAHHIPSTTWSRLKRAFGNRKILQFTATPWRTDGKPIDGKTIYNYPLGQAQIDGYFKSITYTPILCTDENLADEKIALTAVTQLKDDLNKDRDHVLMARCKNIKRAEDVFKRYQKIAPEYSPILIHNQTSDKKNLISRLEDGTSRILVCVNMFGEGFDFPKLKIAAIHDSQKSIATLLQFIGRFTRTSYSESIGNATIIANVADDTSSDAMKELYSEDSDWNKLLGQINAKAIKKHIQVTEFLSNCKRLDEDLEDEITASLSPSAIYFGFKIYCFKCINFIPSNFIDAFKNNVRSIRAAWLNEDSNVLFFITKKEGRVNWGRTGKSIKDRTWDLFVAYFNKEQQILYIYSSDNKLTNEDFASEVSRSTAKKIQGDKIFRSLGNIKRLMFQQVGLKKHGGRRNLRYSMYTGTDVSIALSPAQTAKSTKSNVSGLGFENGQAITIGCSYKGRIWSRERGSIQDFILWCNNIGVKLNDENIDTDKIIENVLIPKAVGDLPDKEVLCIDWPVELLNKQEDKIDLISKKGKFLFSQYEIRLRTYDKNQNEIQFDVCHDNHSGRYSLKLYGETDSNDDPPRYEVIHISGESFQMNIGTNTISVKEFFNDYPPDILFVDGDELVGCDLIEVKEHKTIALPSKNIKIWDWTKVDKTKESMWKDGKLRKDSIQYKAFQKNDTEEFDIIFNDDSKGEAADLICIKEYDNHIELKLFHCKYSGSKKTGKRVKDVVEVCSQAIRSSRWIWNFRKLCKHIVSREKNMKVSGMKSRYLKGNEKEVKNLAKASKFKEVRAEIIIVQPGLSRDRRTDDQSTILSSTHSYLLDTVNIELQVICDK